MKPSNISLIVKLHAVVGLNVILMGFLH